MKQEADRDEIRITQQFRSGEAMIYDLRAKSGRLTLHVSGRGGGEGPATEWRMQASADGVLDEWPVVAEWAPTRSEALRGVARCWNAHRLAHNLPTFDWDSVSRALAAVRAL